MAKRLRDVCALPESEPLWRAGRGFVVFENSPAIHGWVRRQPSEKVPRGTAEKPGGLSAMVAVRKHLSSLAGLWTMAGIKSQP